MPSCIPLRTHPARDSGGQALAQAVQSVDTEMGAFALQSQVTYMQGWLEQQGSDESKIEKADFSDMVEVAQLGFDTFSDEGENKHGTPATTHGGSHQT